MSEKHTDIRVWATNTGAKLTQLVEDLKAECEAVEPYGYDAVISAKTIRKFLRKVGAPFYTEETG